LFRGHVRERPHDGTGLRLTAAIVGLPGQPKVGDLGHAVAGEQDVGFRNYGSGQVKRLSLPLLEPLSALTPEEAEVAGLKPLEFGGYG
jgi:hypothetical protein